jgi:hypothetical protein
MEALDRRTFLSGIAAPGVLGSVAIIAGVSAPSMPNPAHAQSPPREEGDAISVLRLPEGGDSARRIITQPGAYFLDAPLTGVPGQHGIEIRCDNVHIDLRGHTLDGGPGTGSGIMMQSGLRGLKIRNGRICGWGEYGLDLHHATECKVAGVIARNNSLAGIRVGTRCHVRECTCDENGSWGIQLATDSFLSHSSCSSNLRGGISAAARCRVIDNQAAGSPQGICCDSGCHIEGNSTRDNGTALVVSGTRTLLVRNTSRDTTGFNIGPGNAYGPIVHARGAGSLNAIAGADHAWANFIL